MIAYNDKSDLRDLFEACADEARQACVDNNISFNRVFPPDLTEENVINAMFKHQLCFIAAHGDCDGIYNENKGEVISTRTTNYIFCGKGLYSIACSCAENLHPHLQGIGLKFFVGYKSLFTTRGHIEPFVISAMSGFKSFLSGDSIKVAKEKMLASFDEQIEFLDNEAPIAAALLLKNKEALVFEFEGDGTLVLSSL